MDACNKHASGIKSLTNRIRVVPDIGIATAVLGMVGMFRNATTAVAPISAVNNYLLPIWMIIFGVTLLRYRPSGAAVEQQKT